MGWRVEPHISQDVSQATQFYGAGVYTFLRRPGYTPVYRQEQGRALYLGLLADLQLPAGFPPIIFPDGADQLVVVPTDDA